MTTISHCLLYCVLDLSVVSSDEMCQHPAHVCSHIVNWLNKHYCWTRSAPSHIHQGLTRPFLLPPLRPKRGIHPAPFSALRYIQRTNAPIPCNIKSKKLPEAFSSGRRFALRLSIREDSTENYFEHAKGVSLWTSHSRCGHVAP
ncbi:hypothetical protein SISNIDRAFT_176402 [Sistotremastrum niveocremeum HHB9708]|uniref:Secreted protein n=1 Tax=Sistotremastrum niveocremeum HHB9708 TaxID=1314777 RepID=A0A164RR06_9AGAM|nr:hypothetical protein SISNIDRAFT_176402 [Sistotremastrum niveocremeum HHB9708]